MGPSAVRIAAEDFVIPPEFRELALAARSAGQIGGTRLSLVQSDGRTRLGDCYQQVPVRLLPAFHLGNEPASLVYLINPTAGLMDGDGHLLEIADGTGDPGGRHQPVGHANSSLSRKTSRRSNAPGSAHDGATASSSSFRARRFRFATPARTSASTSSSKPGPVLSGRKSGTPAATTARLFPKNSSSPH